MKLSTKIWQKDTLTRRTTGQRWIGPPRTWVKSGKDFINTANLHSEDHSASARKKRKYATWWASSVTRAKRFTSLSSGTLFKLDRGKTDMTSVKRDILERVAEKFKAHLEAKKNPIMAAVKFDRRHQLQGETFDSFVTDLKLLARGLEMTETNKLIRKAIACKLLDERVRQRCLEKAKTLLSKQPSASVECSRPQGMDCRWCQLKTRELKLVKLHGRRTLLGSIKRRETSRNRKVTMSRLRNVSGVDTMHTSHKKSVQPRVNRVISAGNWTLCPSVQKSEKYC